MENAHIISYVWEEFKPLIMAYHENRLEEIDLSGIRSVDISVSKGIWCVGSFTADGYRPCPNNAIAAEWRQCQDCAKPFIPVLNCVFEPRCDGSLCGADFCLQKHVVYLAFFGNLMKIGMTSLKRARERAIEQGADAYAILAVLPNRMAARTLEKKIGQKYGIRQAYGSGEILAQMAKKTDKDDLKVLHTEKLMEIFEELEAPSELVFLNGYPIELPLRRVPKLRPTATRHYGKVLGIKGKYLIYEYSGIYALNISDVVGRRVNLVLR